MNQEFKNKIKKRLYEQLLSEVLVDDPAFPSEYKAPTLKKPNVLPTKPPINTPTAVPIPPVTQPPRKPRKPTVA